ncbi:exodeoxyribonuclease VII large subunit [Alteromonas australica]|uniref:Exodeoxyribonuclease 7 large subunit n=1 Tax=Alteromonas australica TaxID=589873 RepID=A0A075P862_9ALTE|nr:exodeoxyribonuclease VII large subunit [Alteromonas australica]AIF99512.1 exodeoxyribonuclease VII large subunit [Alteromonas australica]
MFTNSPSTSRQILTVTKLNRLARTVLEGEIGLIWLSAEISNFVCAASGHWYFTLKDNKAQVKAAMFKGANRNVRMRPKEGDKILVRASVGLYEARGDYQLVVEHMESDGEGALKQAFEALKARLNTEGLFATHRKQPLPEAINRIGVITSASGAALHDILSVLKRRSPQTEVIVYPSMVQGESAPSQLINALTVANQRNEVDVILLSRGGGALEDLWCFNDETLARHIAQSTLPVVSAVGHEIDFTIADFVADVRAPTPSAAAEILSQDTRALYHAVTQNRQRLVRAMQTQIQRAQQGLTLRQQKLLSVHPQRRIQHQWQSLDRLQLRLKHAMANTLSHVAKTLDDKTQKLAKQSPLLRIERGQNKLNQLDKALTSAIRNQLKDKQQLLGAKAGLLHSVSPLSTLSRGYSITLHNNSAITQVANVKKDDVIYTRVTDGEITSKVVAISRHK